MAPLLNGKFEVRATLAFFLNNADRYLLLDLCALTDTLIADGTGCITPGTSTTGWCSA
ncbi:MAG: hypothetical protein M3137_07210 [Actinomycetota bacterium]|nr:hypothetical protein [Actinomycetota bacterium]